MTRIAFKMLLHDKAKYFALVLGIAFATLLVSQQAAIFHSVVQSTTRDIQDANQADIWVMKPSVETLDQVDQMAELTINRVRSVAGVAWAVPYYQSTAQLRTRDGRIKTIQLFGIDELSLVAAPAEMLIGTVEDLARPDAVIVDAAGFAAVFPGLPLQTGMVVEIGQRRAEIVGICRVGSSWNGLPRVYSRRSLAVEMARETINPVTFVLARAVAGADPDVVAAAITAATGLQARSRAAFTAQTRVWVLRYSGVAENFGITIAMGIVIGVAIVGQTFYMFSLENLRQFAALKAIGVRNTSVLAMIGLQAVCVALIGYGVGIGAANAFFASVGPQLTGGMRGMFMHPGILAGTGAFVLTITVLSCLVSVRRVLVVDPALVFRS